MNLLTRFAIDLRALVLLSFDDLLAVGDVNTLRQTIQVAIAADETSIKRIDVRRDVAVIVVDGVDACCNGTFELALRGCIVGVIATIHECHVACLWLTVVVEDNLFRLRSSTIFLLGAIPGPFPDFVAISGSS